MLQNLKVQCAHHDFAGLLAAGQAAVGEWQLQQQGHHHPAGGHPLGR